MTWDGWISLFLKMISSNIVGETSGGKRDKEDSRESAER
jgi:hypothetical protein